MTRHSLLCALTALAATLAGSPGYAEGRPPMPWPGPPPFPQLPPAMAAAVMQPLAYPPPPAGSVEVVRGLNYAEAPDPNVRLDVYRPVDRARAFRPAVILIHGAAPPATRPKDWGIYQSWGQMLAGAGFVGVSFTHRTDFPQTHLDVGAGDVASAIAYVRANAAKLGVDRDRICLAAFSAGGPLLTPYLRNAAPEIRCLVGVYPLMDVRQSAEHIASESEETQAAFTAATALSKTGRATPVLLLRAGGDQVPKLLESMDQFISTALKADFPLTVINLPGAPHGFDNQAATPRTRETLDATLAFFRSQLDED